MGRPVGASGGSGQCITQTSTKVFAAGRSVHFVEFPPEHRESDRLWNRLPLVGVVIKPPQMPVAESGQGSEGARGFPGGQAGESPGGKPAGSPAGNRPAGRPTAVKPGLQRQEKIPSTHSLTSLGGRITLHAYPKWGPFPAQCALVYGGLLARGRVLLLGTSFGLPDPLLDIPLLKARRLIHGLFLVPQARHLRLLLPQASIGSHDHPVFAILVPRAGDRPAVE